MDDVQKRLVKRVKIRMKCQSKSRYLHSTEESS